MKFKRSASLVLFFCLAAQAADKFSGTREEAKLLSAFIFNISKFTELKNASHQASHKLRLAVVGNAMLAEELRAISLSKKVNDRDLEVNDVKLQNIDTQSIDIAVLIPESTQSVIEQLKKFKGCRCLTVTYEEGVSLHGSVINFYTDQERLRFEVNLKRAKEEELELSSQLLKLGKLIE